MPVDKYKFMSQKNIPANVRRPLNLGFPQAAYTENKHYPLWATHLRFGQWAKSLRASFGRFQALRAPGRRARKKNSAFLTHLWVRPVTNALWIHPILGSFPRSGIYRASHPIQARRIRNKKRHFGTRKNRFSKKKSFSSSSA